MSHPVVAFESCGGINLWQFFHCATASLEASFSHLLAVSVPLRSPPPPQRSLHSIIRVSAMSTIPGTVMCCTPNQMQAESWCVLLGVDWRDFFSMSRTQWHSVKIHSSMLLEIKKWGVSNLLSAKRLCDPVTPLCFHSVIFLTLSGWEEKLVVTQAEKRQKQTEVTSWRKWSCSCSGGFIFVPVKQKSLVVAFRVCVWVSVGGEETTMVMVSLSLMVWDSMF